ncbi:DoxX family membrane protein, partial [Rhizobium ruizarguesonis]
MSGHGNLEEMEETDGFSFLGLFRRYRTPLLAAASLVVLGSLFQIVAGILLMLGLFVTAAAFGLIIFTLAAT